MTIFAVEDDSPVSQGEHAEKKVLKISQIQKQEKVITELQCFSSVKEGLSPKRER